MAFWQRFVEHWLWQPFRVVFSTFIFRMRGLLFVAPLVNKEPHLACRESGAIHPRLLSVPELSHHLAESYHTCCLHLQEMIQYKRQNHGKVRDDMLAPACIHIG